MTLLSRFHAACRPAGAALMLAMLAGCSTYYGHVPPAVPALADSKALPNPQVLLLGEVHDNTQGHRLRYELLRQRVEAGWRPAIAMEQFDRENQALLTKAQAGCLDAECVIRVVGGPRWDWQQYYPVIQLALTYQLPLIAANLSRGDASRVVRDGVASAFDAASVAAYRLDRALPAEIRTPQEQEIAASHCGMLPEDMAGHMVDAQVARDIWMAKLLRAQQPRDVVLIAGNGHVRKDIGVGYWVQRIEPQLTLLSVAFAEGPQPAGQFDVVQRVAPQKRADPCAGIKPKS